MKIELPKTRKKWKKGGFHTNPNIGWGIVLAIALVLVLAALALGVYLFVRTNQEYSGEPSPDSRIKIVKKERIIKVLEYFSSREQRSAEIIQNPSPVIDPSI